VRNDVDMRVSTCSDDPKKTSIYTIDEPTCRPRVAQMPPNLTERRNGDWRYLVDDQGEIFYFTYDKRKNCCPLL
jgi:hypothetical protein